MSEGYDRDRGIDNFLELTKTDAKLREILDNAIDDNILTVATIIANERGFGFTRIELAEALTSRLGLSEVKLNDPESGPGQCKTDSGCRTPSVYCKSNKKPTLGILFNKEGLFKS